MRNFLQPEMWVKKCPITTKNMFAGQKFAPWSQKSQTGSEVCNHKVEMCAVHTTQDRNACPQWGICIEFAFIIGGTELVAQVGG